MSILISFFFTRKKQSQSSGGGGRGTHVIEGNILDILVNLRYHVHFPTNILKKGMKS